MADRFPKEIIAKRAAEVRAAEGRFEAEIGRNEEYAELTEKHRKLSSEYLFGSSRDSEAILADMNAVEKRIEEIRSSYTAPDICRRCSGTGYADGVVCDCVLPEIYVKCFGAEDVSSFTESFASSDPELFNGKDEIVSGKTQRDLFLIVADNVEKYSDVIFRSKGRGLLIMGAPGLGKTFLCRSLAAKASGEKPVMYITAPELARNFLDHRLGEPVELRYIWNAPLLIVDDLGAETCSMNVTSEYLCEMIEKRAAGKLPTVFSTNLSIEDIKNRYGERVSSRLSSDSYSAYMLFGEDIRIRRK